MSCMRSGVKMDLVCELLNGKKEEILNNLLVKVETLPEMANGYAELGLMSRAYWEGLTQALIEDGSGMKYARDIYDWAITYIRITNNSLEDRGLCASLFFNYIAEAHTQAKLRDLYQSRGLDINDLVGI